MKFSLIHCGLLLLLATPTFGATAYTGVSSTYGLEGDPAFQDDMGGALAVGSVIQIGYFAGVSTTLDVTSFTQTEWDSFVPLTGDGSLNPSIATVVGDGGAPAGYWASLANFNTDDHTGITAAELGGSEVRIGVRIFNGSTVASSTFFNTVTANDDGDSGEGNWIMQAAAEPPNVPANAAANLDLAINNSSLSWESGGSGTFQTSLEATAVPEAAESLIMLLGLLGILRFRKR